MVDEQLHHQRHMAWIAERSSKAFPTGATTPVKNLSNPSSTVTRNPELRAALNPIIFWPNARGQRWEATRRGITGNGCDHDVAKTNKGVSPDTGDTPFRVVKTHRWEHPSMP